MAGALTGCGPTLSPGARRALLLIGLLVLLAHLLALYALRQWLRPPSLLAQVTAPLYTRTITVQVPTAVPEPAVAPPISAPKRPSARFRQAPAATKKRVSEAPSPAPEPPTPTPETDAPAPEPALEPEPSLAETPPDIDPPERADATDDTHTAEADSVAAETPDVAAQWPPDTRLTYRLGGNYRGELHGSAEVLWQREGTRYQAVMHVDVGLLLSLRFTSQGEITASGLAPEVYEEQLRKRRRSVRLDADSVRLDKGQRVPRPDGVQDAASQFVELSQRFATGQQPLAIGTQLSLWLARPGGVDEWTYDVVGEDTVHLPRLGAVAAWHLRPRPLAQPRGPISAEIWYAPTLQNLPVRILLTQGPDTWIDLLVDTIEQR